MLWKFKIKWGGHISTNSEISSYFLNIGSEGPIRLNIVRLFRNLGRAERFDMPLKFSPFLAYGSPRLLFFPGSATEHEPVSDADLLPSLSVALHSRRDGLSFLCIQPGEGGDVGRALPQRRQPAPRPVRDLHRAGGTRWWYRDGRFARRRCGVLRRWCQADATRSHIHNKQSANKSLGRPSDRDRQSNHMRSQPWELNALRWY
jgi:hypothetical protein